MVDFETMIHRLPKVDLHCHLDGSVKKEVIEELGGRGIVITAPNPSRDLREYLQCFDNVLPLLQTEEALIKAAYSVIEQAHEEHVIYIEVRFAPGLHCVGDLTEEGVCKAVLKGLELGEKDFGVKSRAILCMMRGMDSVYNQRTLNCAKALKDYGVGGLDIAGNEAEYPPEIYKELFDQAVKWDIPFTIHAGECHSAENVRTAIEMGARRIGHGVAIANHDEIKLLCKQKQIFLEMCPVSNLQTNAVGSIQEYPFVNMRTEGISATISTDNRTVSETTLTREWCVLKESFSQINEQMIRETTIDGIRAAFLPATEKEKLLEAFKEK